MIVFIAMNLTENISVKKFQISNFSGTIKSVWKIGICMKSWLDPRGMISLHWLLVLSLISLFNKIGILKYFITCIERISPWAVEIIWNFQSGLGHHNLQVSNEYLQAAWTSLVESLLQDRASKERSVPILFLYQRSNFSKNQWSTNPQGIWN